MIRGALGFTVVEPAETVNVAGLLVTVPDALVTVTVKTDPLSVLVAAGVV